ncbi:MAG: isoleucine--tRNA ligase [Actinomycetota bacterium]
MFDLVPGRADLVAGEHAILKFWENTQAFEQLRARNAGKPKWSFIDGPITANGFMGVHHAWGRTYKDVFQRYYAMTGHDQRWQNGFDCQGLWVEVQVERDLGFKSKRDIEEYGIENFVQRCKERVWKYSAIQTEQSKRLGMWMDWPNSYFTMSDENNYAIWNFLKKCHERGLIYKGLDAMPWCPRCGTGISEQERKEGYKQVTDEAVYVRFPLRGRDREFLLVWTTTPWTLAANVAAAVNPELSYAKIQKDGDTYYLAAGQSGLLDSSTSESGKQMEQLKGAAMLGWEYDGPFDELDAAEPAREAHKVIAWEEVSETEGTGIVHIAPGCGKEDFDLGKQNGLPVISPIDDSGIYVNGFGPLTGKSALKVAAQVFESLEANGLVFKQEAYTHDYPHCWRCSTPLLFRAVDEWYINMGWRDEITDIVKQIRWIPDYGEDLELDWLKNMGDWMISKKRYWGLALPIYVCEDCGEFDVVGGKQELMERAIEGWEDFVGDHKSPNSPHRPWIDQVKIGCSKCEGIASRIPDVGNPWLDAGIVPYSTTGYNTDRESWESWVPADFVVESFPGQFRNWFYALLTMSTMIENIPPFKTLLGYASVRDEKGEEMHYSKGNAIEFDTAADRMGADVMRWMYCRHNPTNNLSFGYQAGEQVERKVFGTLWNSYLFLANYARLDHFDPAEETIPVAERPEIDRWIVSELQSLAALGDASFKDYSIASFVRSAEQFLDQLSNWYIRSNRQRFWNPLGKDDRDKLAAYQTLYEAMTALARLLAPIIPFLTERIYQNLVVKGLGGEGVPSSVHLTEYPAAMPELVDEELSFQMGVVQEVAGAARALRERQHLRVRQPLAEMRVAAETERERSGIDRLRLLLLQELNIKDLTVGPSLEDLTTLTAKPNFATLGPKYGRDVKTIAKLIEELPDPALSELQAEGALTLPAAPGISDSTLTSEDVIFHVNTHPGWAVAEAGKIQIAIDTRITSELEKEGLARDVVRHIQQLRRDLGLNIEDSIDCYYETDAPMLKQAIEEWHDYIAGETQCENLTEGSLGLSQVDVEIGESKLSLEVVLKSSS